MLHGALDQDIAIQHSHDLLAAATADKEFVILPNTMHDEIDEKDCELFVRTVKAFLSHIDEKSAQRAPHTVNN